MRTKIPKRDNHGHFLSNDTEVWECGAGWFEKYLPDTKKLLYELGFDPNKTEYLKSWNGLKAKGQRPVFYVAIKRTKCLFGRKP